MKGSGYAAALALLFLMPAPLLAQPTANEDFELNIVDRRITEESFEASLAVEIRLGPSEEQGLTVHVGTGVEAQRIDVRLRNVRGRVRFVASLEEVQEVIDSHRSGAR